MIWCSLLHNSSYPIAGMRLGLSMRDEVERIALLRPVDEGRVREYRYR